MSIYCPVSSVVDWGKGWKLTGCRETVFAAGLEPGIVKTVSEH